MSAPKNVVRCQVSKEGCLREPRKFPMRVALSSLKGKAKYLLNRVALAQTLRHKYDPRCLPSNLKSWPESLQNPTDYYKNCVRYFHQEAPSYLKDHRRYFTKCQRGFGEDAFHVMWHALCETSRPSSFLEIGVYRGQVISLVSLAARSLGFECAVCGVSPLNKAGDSVSKYLSSVNYMEDTLKNFQAFQLPIPRLIKGRSEDPLVVEEFSSRRWDLIYIDGNHEYEVARDDFLNCSKILNPGGKIILDDSALYTTFRPPLYATAGHPGPSRLAKEIGSFGFQEVLCVGHNRVFQKQL